MKAKKFEQEFDDGADITASLDLSKGRRVLQARAACAEAGECGFPNMDG